MKVKTSVTLSEDVLVMIDRLTGTARSRSAVIEEAVLEYFEHRRRTERDRQDLAQLNLNADALNEEATEVLSYQVDL